MRANESSRGIKPHYDIVIIGAGINGAASASALACEGLNVLVIDKNDFASGTSSSSSNLIWGGIKYLESYDFQLVYKLCRSRNQLIKHFPSAIKEIRFLATVPLNFRLHPFFIFLGTLSYWALGRFYTRPPKYRLNRTLKRLDPRINTKTTAGGVEYSDAYLVDNDARFVYHFIQKAIKNGATAENYIEATAFHRKANTWHLNLKDKINAQTLSITTNVLINASGPWIDKLNTQANITTDYKHLLSKGVHLIVDITPPAKRVLAFFATDGRLFFVIPMGNRTCIGTTDTPVEQIENTPTQDDIQFILENINARLNLKQKLHTENIISYRCGVRPLAVKNEQRTSDWLSLSRSHQTEVDYDQHFASIYGGKLTDCINIGEEIKTIANEFGLHTPNTTLRWYGEPNQKEKQRFYRDFQQLCNAESETISRVWRYWGSDAFNIIPLIKDPHMQEILIPEIGLIRAEVHLSKQLDKIQYFEDFVRRRYMISLVVQHDDLMQRKATLEIATILFGDQALDQLDAYSTAKTLVK